MQKEFSLDATQMEPPEPLLLTLEKLNELGQGDYLRFRHRREPLPLYDSLNQCGFSFITCIGNEVEFEVFIWHKNDDKAQAIIEDKINADKLVIHTSSLNNATS